MVMLISSTDDLAGLMGTVRRAKRSGVALFIRRMRVRFRDERHKNLNFALFSCCPQPASALGRDAEALAEVARDGQGIAQESPEEVALVPAVSGRRRVALL